MAVHKSCMPDKQDLRKAIINVTSGILKKFTDIS